MRIDTPVLEDAKALSDELKQAYLGEPLRAASGHLETFSALARMSEAGGRADEISTIK